MFDFDAAAAAPDCGEFDDVVVVDGAAVGDVELDDDEEDALVFELGVGDAGGSEEFGAGDFHPGDVRGVVGDAHGVAFAVADAEAGGAGACPAQAAGGGC